MVVKARGRALRCHCPTTGRLGNLELAGLPCLISAARVSTGRKTAFTVEAVSTTTSGRRWVGINQSASNRYFEHFLRAGAFSRLASGEVRREIRLGSSRIDFLVGDTYVEVKTPLMMLEAGEGAKRATHSRFDSFDRLIRHMGELRRSLAAGKRAAIVLCFLYDAEPFEPPERDDTNSRIIDASRAAERAGVERWQANFSIDKDGVSLVRYFRSGPRVREAGRGDVANGPSRASPLPRTSRPGSGRGRLPRTRRTTPLPDQPSHSGESPARPDSGHGLNRNRLAAEPCASRPIPSSRVI
jgi:sugar fermentation stimulation protein A